MTEAYNLNALPPGTMLQEHEILRVLGAGSFGTVYPARGKAIRMETALEGLLTPQHPGAERFYKDQGLLK